MMANHELIVAGGLEAFLEQQAGRIAFLEEALEKHNNGRNKNFFCLAAALLSVKSLEKALVLVDKPENIASLRDVLSGLAEAEGVEL